MACSTCQRRRRLCDDLRPRCSPCKTSHLRCAYDGPFQPVSFRSEYESTVQRYGGCVKSTKSKSSEVGRGDGSVGVTTPSTRFTATPQHAIGDVSEPGSGDMLQGTFEGVFAPQFSSWGDEFYEMFSFDEASHPEFDLPDMISSLGEPSLPDMSMNSQTSHLTPHMPIFEPADPIASAPAEKSHNDDERQSKKVKIGSLPVHLLAQHFSRQLTGRYSFKSADWTFYTYFFHRFTNSHPWVLSSILAWTSAHLFYSGKAESLETSLSHYGDCVAHMSKQYGRTIDTIDATWDAGYDENLDKALSNSSTDDIDAIFVGHFFLALFDLITARGQQIRKILRFIAHVLRIPNVKTKMGGVRSRVATWFCILDGKASAFQNGDGAVLDAIGGEDGLVRALNSSYSTLQQVYSVTYPDEERKDDETQLPLLERILRLMSLLREITQAKDQNLNPHAKNFKHIRAKLDTHRNSILTISATESFHGRSRSTFLVLNALYNSVEISYSRSMSPTSALYEADIFAAKIIQIAQQLNSLRSSTIAAPPSSPPPTKIWPLPLVMAAIEVRDPVYREWVLDRLRAYEDGAGDQYLWARRFVEAVTEREGRDGRRVDWGLLMAEVKDQMVI